MIRAAFFDVDGTLVGFHQTRISDRLRSDLLALQEKGVLLFLATGRARQDLARTGMMRDVAFDGYLTLNGQCCFNAQEIYRDVPICRKDLEAVCRLLNERPELPIIIEGDGFSGLTRVDDHVREMFDFLHTDLYPVCPPETMLREKTYQVVPLVKLEEEALFLSVMPHCTHTRWHPQGIDITPLGGGKAAGVRATMEHYGLSREEIIAFGDGENDLSMLELAGTSVAMGNGIESVKAAADYVTASAEEDGVSQALRHFGLLEE